jgi:hypothetical protein
MERIFVRPRITFALAPVHAERTHRPVPHAFSIINAHDQYVQASAVDVKPHVSNMRGHVSRTSTSRPNHQNKVSKFRKKVTSALTGPTYAADDHPFHMTQGDFMDRCREMKIGNGDPEWNAKLSYMDLEQDL